MELVDNNNLARALVVGSSGGIGKALAKGLKDRGHDVTELSRTVDGLEITDSLSVQEQIDRLQGQFDTVIVATGALCSDESGPEKTLKAFNAETMAAQFSVNAIGPMLILKYIAKRMPSNRRTVFAVLSARVGSIGDNNLGGWYSYRASKAALNQLIRTASIEMTRANKHSICIALHPGTVLTSFTENYKNHQMVSSESAATNLLNVIDSLTEEETGMFLDWEGEKVPW